MCEPLNKKQCVPDNLHTGHALRSPYPQKAAPSRMRKMMRGEKGIFMRICAEFLFQHKFHGAVVTAKNVRMDCGAFHFRHKALRDNKIVDAPADILLTGMETVRPP